MKILLILLLFTFTLFSASIDNYAKSMSFERDYKSALTKAKKEKKILVMVLSADYCPWCRKFERKTLSSKLIKPKLNKEFITLVVDNKYDLGSFPKKFETPYTPKVFFIDPKDESILNKTTGYIKKKDFLSTLDDVRKLYEVSQ